MSMQNIVVMGGLVFTMVLPIVCIIGLIILALTHDKFRSNPMRTALFAILVLITVVSICVMFIIITSMLLSG